MTEPDDRDMLAAEYVLGTLDAGERATVAARLAGDADLARAVAAWEDRLSPLAESAREVTPPAEVYSALMTRLFGDSRWAGSVREAATASVVPVRRLRRWQMATGGLALLAASLSAWVALREIGLGPAAGPRFTAVLQRDAGAPAMILDIDLATRRLTIKPLLTAAPAGRSYELWIIDPVLGAPRSLGVVPAKANDQESLSAYDPAVIEGATYAVTIEPVGGSPTGRPSAAPILTGKLAVTPS